MPHLDLTTATMVRVGDQYVDKVQIANETVWEAPYPVQSTGGTITTVTIGLQNYRVHTFTEDGVFELYGMADVEYLVVGAGSSGARRNNGGSGGAGGRVRHNIGSAKSLIGIFPIVVGKGGTPATTSSVAGGNSIAFGQVAEGGLAGSNANGAPGASQGGVGGHVGGAGLSPRSGGGAGDGGNGGDADATNGGAAGPGTVLNITGTPTEYGAGGAGSKTTADAVAGIDGLGSGGDGIIGTNSGTAMRGGDGIVIVRYPI